MITQTESAILANPSKQDQTEHISRSILLMMLLVVINAAALGYKGKLATKYRFIGRIIPDANITTAVGIIAGAFLSVIGEHATLEAIGEGYASLFMIILLPAIIFESTINMHKESFFKNIGSILMFAIFGTLIAMILTAFGVYFVANLLSVNGFSLLECFAFGSLISATDAVSVLAGFKTLSADKMLYSLIFGESILNDAISITSYNTFVHIATETTHTSFFDPIGKFFLILLGSTLLGIAIGIGCSIILKKYFAVDLGFVEGLEGRSLNQGSELSLMIIAPWVSYLIGEGFGMSGIVTILFCGIAINKYALPNLTTQARKLTQNLYHVLSSNFENLTWMFIGIGFFSFNHNMTGLGWIFFILCVLIITVSRFSQVYIVSWLLNKFRHNNKITDNFRAVIAHAGFRGAMSFALAISASNAFSSSGAGSIMLTITLVYAGLTTFLLGSVLVPLMEYYDVKEKPQAEPEKVENNVDTSSHYLWNRIKVRFGLLDDWLIDVLVINPRKEKLRIQAAYGGNDVESPTKDTQASFMSNQTIVETEMTSIDKSKGPERVA